MHDVVEMLLTRIKDYPEDFVSDPQVWGSHGEPNKWQKALGIAKEVMTEEEKVVIGDALEMAKRAVYMGAALKTIMSEEVVEEPEPNLYKHQSLISNIGQHAVHTVGSITANTIANTATNSAQQVQRAQQAQRAQLEYQSQSSILNALNSISFLGQP